MPVVLISTSQSASASTRINILLILFQVLVLVLVQVKVLLVHVLVKERRQFHIMSTWMLEGARQAPCIFENAHTWIFATRASQAQFRCKFEKLRRIFAT